MPERSARFASRAAKELRREMLVTPAPELGLVALNGPNDPEPELVVENGVVVRMDGRAAAEFDVIDRFLVAHGLDLEIAPRRWRSPTSSSPACSSTSTCRASEAVRLARGLTPAKLARVAGLLDPVELMFALKKLRARRAPANQAHVTNLKESPALLAADAAEASARGFAELETTVGVARYAPLNAIALLVGSQTGRPGVMTQCAVEERRNLELAINGLVTYAETLSVYGTEQVFVDGDDTPWSKSFLGAAYASRGVKVRFTSGTGSEALMGEAEGMSMLYLEARCISVVRAAGSQGVQNGSISCVALVLSLPGGTRAILAENVIAAWLDLEVASGNDAIASHSAIRKTAKLMGQFLPGTDFVTSGYSVMPRHDNTFGGGNYDADDLDEWLTIQRDWQVDGGIEPVGEAEVTRVRERAARAVQAVFAEIGLPPVTDAEVEAATSGYDASDMPDRDRAADVEAADAALERKVSGLDVALALDRRGFADIARAIVDMQRQRVSADYLQTSAVIDADGRRPLGGQRPELVHGAGHRLPARGSEVGGSAGAARTSSTPRRSGSARAMRRRARRGRGRSDRRHGSGRGRDRGRAGVRRHDPRDDQRPRPRRRARRDPRRRRRGGRRAARDPGAARGGRRVRRARRGSALGLGRRARHSVQGHRGHPSSRPAAARQPRALRDVPALHARELPRDGTQRRGLRARPPRRAGADRARQLRAREGDRPHDPAARARDPRRRAGSCSRRARARTARSWCDRFPPVRRLLSLPALAGATALAAGCGGGGGGSSTTSAADWASGYCKGATSWVTTLDEARASVKAGIRRPPPRTPRSR